MKHRFILCLIALILCCACCLPASAEYDTPDAWNLTFETDDVIAAAKEVCLIYGGLGIWEKGQVQTVGCVVLEQNESDDKIELALYTARSVFDCSSGSPERIAGGLKPVKLIFEKEGNGLRLLSYQKMELRMQPAVKESSGKLCIWTLPSANLNIQNWHCKMPPRMRTTI